MAQIIFANNASSTLASGITNVATSVTVAPGTGSKFPQPTPGQYFCMTFIDTATGLVNEIVHVTNVSTDTMTIVRAQEGTTALAWLAGDIAANLWTAGSAAAMTQSNQLQLISSNYAADAGSANAYAATYSPPIPSHTTGMPLWVKIADANTGASTFNPGPGIKSIKNPDSTDPVAGQLLASGIACLMYDGSVYQLLIVIPSIATNADYIAGTSPSKVLTPLAVAGTNTTSPFFIQMPGGGIIQGGTTGAITGAGGSSSTNFSTAFPSTCVAVSFSARSGSGSAQARDFISAKSRTAFTITNNGNNSTFDYIAIGF